MTNSILTFILFISLYSYASGNNIDTRIFHADVAYGQIGPRSNNDIDEASDNVFIFDINETVLSHHSAFLVYELHGIDDYKGALRSINNQYSYGGLIVEKSSVWNEQRERISIRSLQQGTNIVQFGIGSSGHDYRVKNVRIELNNQIPTEHALITSPKVFSEYGFYVKGVMTTLHQIVLIQGQQVEVNDGEFEYSHQFGQNESHENSMDLEITSLSGEHLQSCQLSFRPGCQYPLSGHSSETNFSKKRIKTTEGGSISAQFAKLVVPEEALINDQIIKTRRLHVNEVAPTGSSLTNVSISATAHRFLPHGLQFEKNATLTLTYDDELVPDGYNESDIRIYYFHVIEKTWKAIPRDSIDIDNNMVTGFTNHFTDFIAGIIKVPESPVSNAYTPTSIRDLKAADPSSGIMTISPPWPSNMGKANLSFPIKLPQGRNGMTPEVILSYNNEGTNGWLGLGWSYQFPAITIDTRWGVPRFNKEKETETYSLNGQQLSPVSHRESLKNRKSGEVPFYLRVETKYQKITRHGSNAKNYIWTVHLTNGTKHIYGSQDGEAINPNSVLTDKAGNIAHWTLSKTIDSNGNTIIYSCSIQKDSGLDQSASIGQQIYPQKIIYTGHAQQDGSYSIEFRRDRDLNTELRVDKQISARLGFKQVTADLLKKIIVKYK